MLHSCRHVLRSILRGSTLCATKYPVCLEPLSLNKGLGVSKRQSPSLAFRSGTKRPLSTTAIAGGSDNINDYKIRIVTGDKRGAATEANVYIVLQGKSGIRSKRIHLCPPNNKFERGSDYTFTVSVESDEGECAGGSASSLDDIDRVEVLHDGKGLGAAWLIECILVGKGNTAWMFPCGRWMGSGATTTRLDKMVHKVLECKSVIHDGNFFKMELPHPSDNAKDYVSPSPTAAASASASSSLSDESSTARPLSFISASYSIPHPDKKKEGFLGEDASFHLPSTKYPHVSALGVADGVGDWSKIGIDSGAFSRFLMSSTRRYLVSRSEEVSDPVSVLMDAWSHMKGIPGSSTVCLAVLHQRSRNLRIANLGDSGFILIRDGKPLLRSTPQEHFWGHPFQLSSLNKDEPKDCESYSAIVRKGDILILASDGLWDNLFDHEIVDLAWRGRYVSTEQVAHALVDAAYLKSLSKESNTPFAQVAAEEMDMVVNGGKKDDITVVVGKVVYMPTAVAGRDVE